MSDGQLSLFSDTDPCNLAPSVGSLPPLLEMSQATLQQWKGAIARYQHQVRQGQSEQQGTLFDLPNGSANPDHINPFTLPQQNTEFWRWRSSADQGMAALYFVIDYEVPLLLYVGETVKSNQRWKGEHDCKRYLLNYRQAHYQHHLSSLLGIAFWMHAPVQARPRQRLESALIYKWRSPFNKENWDVWGTPFTL